jgi:hypothetical protein
MDVEWLKPTDAGGGFKATGSVVKADGTSAQAVQMRLELACFNLADKNPELAGLDGRLTEHNRRRWDLLNVVVDKGLG